MEKRELGKTREKVPVVGMGTWQMGDARGEAHSLEVQTLRRGIELGMTLIDTAEMYGRGNSARSLHRIVRWQQLTAS